MRFWAELCRFVHGGVGAQKVDGRSQTKPFACKVFIVSGLGGIECMSDRVSGDGWGGLGPGRGTRRRGGFLWRAGDEIFGFQGSCGDVSGGDIFAGMGGLRGCARFTNALVRTRCKDSIVAGDIRPAGGPMSVYSHGPGGMRDVLPKTGGHCFVSVPGASERRLHEDYRRRGTCSFRLEAPCRGVRILAGGFR